MKKILWLLLIFAGIFLVLMISSYNADAASVTWKQSAGSLASVNNNWENGTAPTTGDYVYFTSLSTVSCTWDITSTVGYFDITSGYSGTITLSSNLNIGNAGYFQAGGTLTSSASYTVTDSGSFIRNSGTVTDATVKLALTGTGQLKLASSAFLSLIISGPTVFGSNIGTYAFSLNSGGSINVGSYSFTVYCGYASGSDIIFNGAMTGTGTTLLIFGTTDRTISGTGNIGSPISINAAAGASGNRKLTVSSNLLFTSSLIIGSSHVTNNMSLELAGYSVNTGDININSRGLIIGSGSVICSGNFNSYNGTASGSWSLTMTGTSPYIKTPSANIINGLTWTATNLRLASSLNVTKTFYVGGTYTAGTKTITVGNGCNVTVTNGNTWTLMGQTRYWNRVIIAGTLTCATPVSVWCNSTAYFNGTVNNNVVLHCNSWTQSQGGYVGYIWLESAYRNYIYYNGTFVRINWNMTTAWTLIEGFTPNPGDGYSKAGTMSIVTALGNSMNISSLSGNSFIIDLIVWSVIDGQYKWTIQNLGAPTVFTFTFSVPVTASEVTLYKNDVYMNVLMASGGYISFYDTLTTNDEISYLIVSGAQSASMIDWYVIGMCLAILALVTYAAFRNETFFIIAGMAWIAVSVLEFQPIQNTIALICLAIGMIFALWGVYKFFDR